MPEVTVLSKRPRNPRGLSVVKESGAIFPLPTSPSRWDYKDVQRWGQVEREGHKTITRLRGSGLRTLSFTILVAALNTRTSVETQVSQLTGLGARGEVFRFKGGSPTYNAPCWWYLKDMGITANRLTPEGLPSQVSVDFSLEEYVNPVGSIIKPPTPTGPTTLTTVPLPSPVIAAVYRYHTTVAGDTLQTISTRYLGTLGRWTQIYELNKAAIGPNPNLLRAGLYLQIPPK